MTDTAGFPIVALGASAGGIQALTRFFECVPADSGAAYVVILHLSPSHDSRLAEVLQTAAAIPVSQVHERTPLAPNHVYVIPPDRTLLLDDGALVVGPVTRMEDRRAPVDMFFRTLAREGGPRAVAVVLSGTGANGSMGIKSVKEEGGIVLVQRPEEAEHGDMPRHALATGLVDAALPVADMPARIVAYLSARDSLRLPAATTAPAPTSDEHALRDLFSQLRMRTGHDFSNYKRATVLRRIGRRMGLHNLPDLGEYAQYFREHPEEAQGLLKDLLISVTNFFRDRDAFETLERQVIPGLFAGKTSEDQVRVWVAGCATGEEAYSLAMLLAEHAAAVPGSPAVQVFATDIDEAAIAVAREGLYSLNDTADVSAERLRRFFVQEGESYRVRKDLREMVLFAQHNIIKDPPFSHLDLVSCRNLLIYLNRSAQRRVMEVIQFALNREGFLLLGLSESIEGSQDLFVPFDKDAHIFQSRGVAARFSMPVPEPGGTARVPPRMPADESPAESRTRDRVSVGDLHQRLVEEYAPPSIIVDHEYDIVHISERAGRYLQYGGGEPSHNLLKVIRPELRIEVRTALYQAAQQHASVEARPLTVRIDDRTVALSIIVRPVLKETDPARGFYLVLFQERDAGAAARPEAATISQDDTARQLEEEVQRVKSQLRAAIEQHESQSEELKASNEELQAMNEELRSSTEELGTSREELQSLNEELRMVNQELRIKIEEQAQANDDIQNLINSTEIGTIFLDRSSRIKLFTPRARDLYTLIPADRGRPLSDISSALAEANLEADITRVLERLERVEREVQTRDGRWQLMRILPYRTSDDRIDGVVLTFVDVTERRRAEEALRASEGRLKLVIESLPEYAIFTLDPDGRIDSWSAGASRLFGYADQEVLGQPAALIFTPEDRQAGVPGQEMARARQQGRAADERWHVRKDGSRFHASGLIAPLLDGAGGVLGFVKIAQDLTDRKRWDEAQAVTRQQLETRVADATAELAATNASLETELRQRTGAEAQVRGLLARLISIQEDERRRIARDLHDEVGQQLVGLRLHLDALDLRLNTPPGTARAAIDELRQIAERLDRELDFFAWELRPAALDDFGLVQGLSTFVKEWSAHFGIAAEFQGRRMSKVRLAPEVETNLYRIVQEALNNVYKHAKASRVAVLLERRGREVALVIEDDGVGFDPSSHTGSLRDGIGLVGMRERAALIGGTLDIETADGGGTAIFVHVPLPDQVG